VCRNVSSRQTRTRALSFFARDPVKRAISSYNHAALVQGETVNPEKFFEEKAGKASLLVSRYTWQLEPYLDIFPRDRFLFIEFEKFCKTPATYADIIGQHIGYPGRLPLPESLDNKSNSSQELGGRPGWLGQLRKTSLGRWLRKNTHREVIDWVKPIIYAQRRVREAPELPDTIQEQLISMLSEDTQQFRKLSGIKGETWSIPG